MSYPASRQHSNIKLAHNAVKTYGPKHTGMKGRPEKPIHWEQRNVSDVQQSDVSIRSFKRANYILTNTHTYIFMYNHNGAGTCGSTT